MRLWYCIRTVSSEPSLFAHMKYRSRRRVRPKNRTSSPTGWLRMRVWRMSLLGTKGTIISWDSSIVVVWALGNPWKNLRFGSFIRDDSSKVLEGLRTDANLWPFILIYGSYFGCMSSSWGLDRVHFVPCGGCIETVDEDVNFCFLFCNPNNIICEAGIWNKQSCWNYPHCLQCLTHDSLQKNVKEGWW